MSSSSSSSSCVPPGQCSFKWTGSSWSLYHDRCCPGYYPVQPSGSGAMAGDIVQGRCAPRVRLCHLVRYFVAGNLWLIFAILLTVGSSPVNDGADRSFFGNGQTPTALYLSIDVLALIVSLAYFALYAWCPSKEEF